MTEPSNADLDAINSDPAFQSDLEDLYSEVLAAGTKRHTKSRDPAARLPDSSKTLHDLFVLPENWTRQRGVALFHDESQSIIGNFSEYTHNSVKGCRKLVREESPIVVSAVEHVSGDWWIGVDRRPEPMVPWRETRLASMKLHLPELGVWAPLVQLAAKLEHGGIARAELAADTQFADSDGRMLITLPAGTNVLPVMPLDFKIQLRQEIGL